MNVIQSTRLGARMGRRYLEHGEFVPAAAATSEVLPAKALEDPNQLFRLYTARRAMSQTLGKALPLESELKRVLTWRLRVVDREIGRREHTPEFNLPTIDPVFLSWKSRRGLPGFSIFSIESDTTMVSYYAPPDPMLELLHGNEGAVNLGRLIEMRGQAVSAVASRPVVTPGIPDIMSEHYLDAHLRTNLQSLCEMHRLERVELTAKYVGVMPESVREKIHAYRNPKDGSPAFEQIFVVGEAPDESWQVKEIPRDPLVIGVAFGVLWVIDTFDLTPTERFARDLCVTSATKKNN